MIVEADKLLGNAENKSITASDSLLNQNRCCSSTQAGGLLSRHAGDDTPSEQLFQLSYDLYSSEFTSKNIPHIEENIVPMPNWKHNAKRVNFVEEVRIYHGSIPGSEFEETSEKVENSNNEHNFIPKNFSPQPVDVFASAKGEESNFAQYDDEKYCKKAALIEPTKFLEHLYRDLTADQKDIDLYPISVTKTSNDVSSFSQAHEIDCSIDLPGCSYLHENTKNAGSVTVTFLEETVVESVTIDNDDKVTVQLKMVGHEDFLVIPAKKVVLCTGAWTGHVLKKIQTRPEGRFYTHPSFVDAFSTSVPFC